MPKITSLSYKVQGQDITLVLYYLRSTGFFFKGGEEVLEAVSCLTTFRNCASTENELLNNFNRALRDYADILKVETRVILLFYAVGKSTIYGPWVQSGANSISRSSKPGRHAGGTSTLNYENGVGFSFEQYGKVVAAGTKYHKVRLDGSLASGQYLSNISNQYGDPVEIPYTSSAWDFLEGMAAGADDMAAKLIDFFTAEDLNKRLIAGDGLKLLK